MKEEVVEMKQDSQGKYQAVTVAKREVPQVGPPHIPRPEKMDRMTSIYKFLDGFVMGLDVMERFFHVMKRGYRR